MQNLTHKDFEKMFLLAFQRVSEREEEINKINVFPVPDQDTGTNLKKTLLGIKETIEKKKFQNLKEFGESILEAALISAQGNIGVIFTGFLVGFFSFLSKNPAQAKVLGQAFIEGAERARKAIHDPKEGTVLDVIFATAQAFKRESEEENNIVEILKRVIEKATDALLATREKMAVLKKANVVDAGGFGFLIVLKAFQEALEGEIEEKERISLKEMREVIQVLSSRYEVIALIRRPKLDDKGVKEQLKNLGNSLDIVQVGNKMKIHIHTDHPDEVKNIVNKIGVVESLRIEDMSKEIIGEESVRKVSIGIVTDEVADLTKKIIERYQIEVLPFKVFWPEGEKLKGENIYQKMQEAERLGIKNLPKTSQASPKEYFDAFERQFKKGFEKILCITLSSKLSGAFNSALQGREMLSQDKKERVFVLDSQNVSAGQALLVLRAIELIHSQMEVGEILVKLKQEVHKIYAYGFLKDPKWVEWGGRVSRSQANWLRRLQKLGIRPLLGIKNGKVEKIGFRIGVREIHEAIFREIEARSTKVRKEGKKIRVVITHCDNLSEAKKLKEKLKTIGAEISFINLTGPVFGVHVGPGALTAGWMGIE